MERGFVVKSEIHLTGIVWSITIRCPFSVALVDVFAIHLVVQKHAKAGVTSVDALDFVFLAISSTTTCSASLLVSWSWASFERSVLWDFVIIFKASHG